MYNTVSINPAYAGSRSVLSVFGLHRAQWIGLDGAPVTNSISLNTPIKNSNLGMGISILNDKIGPSDENAISADVSYSIRTSEDYKLSFGIKLTADLLNIDYNKVSRYNPDDALASQNIVNKFSPNIGAGLYFSSLKSYYGLSVPNFLETKYFDKQAIAEARKKMHIYFITGHVFELSDDVKLKPALLVKMVQGAPLQADLSTNFMYSEKFILGAAYRWDAAFSVMAGFQVSPSWFIGYSYDKDTSKLAKFNSGSHEFFLRYELFGNYGKAVSPRFF
jgi:type IX secretion system PorP/SprF family membrane protein